MDFAGRLLCFWTNPSFPDDHYWIAISSDNTLVRTKELTTGVTPYFRYQLNANIQEDRSIADDAQSRALNPCEVAKIKLLLQVTVGALTAAGFGAFINSGTSADAVYSVIEQNPVAKAALENMIQTLTNQSKITPQILADATVDLIKSFYQAGVLSDVISTAFQWSFFQALLAVSVKIVEIFVLPEAEAAELLAAASKWVLETAQLVQTVAHTCDGKTLVFVGFEGLDSK